jgi:hypothetical protein
VHGIGVPQIPSGKRQFAVAKTVSLASTAIFSGCLVPMPRALW